MAGKPRAEDFFSGFRSTHYRKNETILHPGENPSYVYFVVSGFVRLFSVFTEGRELTLNILKPGSYFPMIWAIGGIPNTYYYQAMTSTELRRSPAKVVLDFLKENPEELFELTRRLLVGVDALLTNIEHLLSGTAHHRVACALLLSARRFGRPRGKTCLIELPLTHQDIANIAGLSREKTSLELEKLQKERIVHRQNHLWVVSNLKKLESRSLIYKNETVLPQIV